jgi:toxin ParE1/3/4
MRAVLHAEAEEELTEAALYLERERRGAGERFFDAFYVARDFIELHPRAGRPVDFAARAFDIAGFSYDLIYTQWKDELYIVAIAHHRRRPGYWFDRL